MLHFFKLLLAVAVVAGVSAVPTISKAESAKSEAASGAKKSSAAADDFEENRRAHTQKSKENNANKGAN